MEEEEEGASGLAPSFVGKLRTGMAAARAAGLLLHSSHLASLAPGTQLGLAGAAGAAVGLLQTAVVALWVSSAPGGDMAAALYHAAAVAGIVATSLALSALARVSGITVLGAAADVSCRTGDNQPPWV